jgi:hypothetical protein
MVVLIAGGGASSVRVIEDDAQDARADRAEHLHGALRGVPTRGASTKASLTPSRGGLSITM